MDEDGDRAHLEGQGAGDKRLREQTTVARREGGDKGGGPSGLGDDGEQSEEDAASVNSDDIARERELDERLLEDEMSGEETEHQRQPIDDASQTAYVNSLTLPRATTTQLPAPSNAASSTRTSQEEPGNGLHFLLGQRIPYFALVLFPGAIVSPHHLLGNFFCRYRSNT